MRLTALFPLACAIVGFVLSMLCLFAGSKKGYLENYHIVTLNTSSLGQVLLESDSTATATSATATATSVVGGMGAWLEGVQDNVTDAVDDVEDEFNDLVSDVADKLSQELGIHQWYSLHMLNLCQGDYTPNATAKGASKNATSCTKMTAMYNINLDQILSQQLQVGPLNLDLSDISWPDDINKGFQGLNVVLNAVFVIYAIGIASAGLAILTSALAIFFHGSRLVSVGNFGLALLSFLALAVDSALVTFVQDKAVHIINKYGNAIGVYADKGGKYLALTWTAVVVMFLAAAVWAAEFCIGRRQKGREYTEKPPPGRRWGRSHRSDEAQRRKGGV
ncbi:SUR7 protein [Diplocarpon rosae]|nr:SUR7 protein [Diplocarpon rosae]